MPAGSLVIGILAGGRGNVQARVSLIDNRGWQDADYFSHPFRLWKKGDFRKGGDRQRWLNSPNVYQKVEVLETGTTDPKKITKVEIVKIEMK